MNPTTPAKATPTDTIQGINWNNLPDEKDKEIWERLTNNFWLDTKIPLSNDIPTWSQMTDHEHAATMRVFAGLTLLDTIQGTVGAVSLIKDAATQHEEAVYTNIAFMESVHAKSYSSIFQTLASTTEINDAFNWANTNEHLQYKAHRILNYYRGNDPYKKKAASVLLESFLFYSGFFLPLKFASRGKLTNTADIIRLILRDESVHGLYIGLKAQQGIKHEPQHIKDEYAAEVIDLLMDLYDNELSYAEEIYDPLGWTEDVKRFLRYNANKALNNLGMNQLFPADECQFDQAVRTSLDPSSNETHDFFSGSGSSYVIGKTEHTTEDDWDF